MDNIKAFIKQYKRVLIIASITAVLAVGMFSLAVLFALTNTNTAAPPTRRAVRATPRPTTYRVEYMITGSTGRASITYNNEQEGTQQEDIRAGGGSFSDKPLRIRYTMKPGTFAYISVQNENKAGSVRCRILIDSHIWRESVSEGGYKIATCSGRVGED